MRIRLGTCRKSTKHGVSWRGEEKKKNRNNTTRRVGELEGPRLSENEIHTEKAFPAVQKWLEIQKKKRWRLGQKRKRRRKHAPGEQSTCCMLVKPVRTLRRKQRSPRPVHHQQKPQTKPFKQTDSQKDKRRKDLKSGGKGKKWLSEILHSLVNILWAEERVA